MSDFSRIPRGFLAFLRAETGGRNPNNFTEELRPTLDMFPFYGAERLSSVAIVGSGFQSLFVPRDETWFLTSVSCQGGSAPSTVFRSHVLVQTRGLPSDPLATELFPLASFILEAPTTAIGDGVGFQSLPLTPLLPNAEIVVNPIYEDGAALSYTTRIGYYQLKSS